MPMIATWMLERTTQQWCDLLEPNAVPCAPILNLPQVFEHRQVVHRGMKTQLIDAQGRRMPLVANPMRFDGQRAVADQPPPHMDEHGDAIRAGRTWPER
jgi:crotonobetainyl-CoA:carnitine CoA-transferase CaiB-like acyl-CoA transferase